jgi:hypothetical protein
VVDSVLALVVVGKTAALLTVPLTRGFELVLLLCPQARVVDAAIPELVLLGQKLDHVIKCEYVPWHDLVETAVKALCRSRSYITVRNKTKII